MTAGNVLFNNVQVAYFSPTFQCILGNIRSSWAEICHRYIVRSSWTCTKYKLIFNWLIMQRISWGLTGVVECWYPQRLFLFWLMCWCPLMIFCTSKINMWNIRINLIRGSDENNNVDQNTYSSYLTSYTHDRDPVYNIEPLCLVTHRFYHVILQKGAL